MVTKEERLRGKDKLEVWETSNLSLEEKQPYI